MQYVNITGYKFVELTDLEESEKNLRRFCLDHQVKGTIILSHEGINVAMAGLKEDIEAFESYLRQREALKDLTFKYSYSEALPFRHLYIRIKQEIIAMRVPDINPNAKTGKRLLPKEFKQWLDENRDITVLDTRNDYEVKVGTFDRAIHLNVETFRDFPEAAKQLPDEIKKKPLVMFCTGGVRCEKASALFMNYGFEEVYQLEGGIVKYFEDCEGAHWDGECFVFDDRIAVQKNLSPSEKNYCLNCLSALTEDDLKHPNYESNQSCPYCLGQREKYR